ncbi:MAG: hypothetical protein AAGJ97_10760 [Planctomycetota bacterium]
MSAGQAARLFDQQMWCWGRDIEHADGNLLIEYGFQRLEKPAGSDAVSVYRLEPSPTSRVVLRGFGVFCGDDRWGGIFLRRFDFTPQATPEADLPRPPWLLQDLPPLSTPHERHADGCRRLLLQVIDRIRDYEAWVAARLGTGYRGETLLPWEAKHGKAVAADQTAVAWRMLGLFVSDDAIIGTHGD